MSNKTHCKIGIGLTVDVKGGGRASYEVLKYNGIEREVLYDTESYQVIPKFLLPVKTNINILEADENGRNNALFGYLIPLQQNEFTKEECRECIEIINEFVLKEPLPESELKVVLRDGAFECPTFFNSKGAFLFDQFARYFVQTDHIVKIGGKLHIYCDGIYKEGDDNLEAAMIKHIPKLKQAQRKEVLSYLTLLLRMEFSILQMEVLVSLVQNM